MCTYVHYMFYICRHSEGFGLKNFPILWICQVKLINELYAPKVCFLQHIIFKCCLSAARTCGTLPQPFWAIISKLMPSISESQAGQVAIKWSACRVLLSQLFLNYQPICQKVQCRKRRNISIKNAMQQWIWFRLKLKMHLGISGPLKHIKSSLKCSIKCFYSQ